MKFAKIVIAGLVPVKEMGCGSLIGELTKVVITGLVAVIHGSTGVELFG